MFTQATQNEIAHNIKWFKKLNNLNQKYVNSQAKDGD